MFPTYDLLSLYQTTYPSYYFDPTVIIPFVFMFACDMTEPQQNTTVSIAAQMVTEIRSTTPNCHFNKKYDMNLSYSNESNTQINNQTTQSEVHPGSPIRKREVFLSDFPTIRALARAPFSSTVYQNCDFLISAEEYFEDNPLIATTLNIATQNKYITAYERFRSSEIADVTDDITFDQRIAAYIQMRFNRCSRPGVRQEMSNLICMLVIMYPNLKTELGLSRRHIWMEIGNSIKEFNTTISRSDACLRLALSKYRKSIRRRNCYFNILCMFKSIRSFEAALE